MAVDYYLRVGGIKGEADHKAHKDEIGLTSFSWGAYVTSHPAYGGGGYGAGRAKAGDFTFTLRVTRASPKLLEACFAGTMLGQVVVTAHKAGGDHSDMLTWALEDARVTAYGISGVPTDARPEEFLQIDAQRVQIQYRGQTVSGKEAAAIVAGWDLKKNTAITGSLVKPKAKRKQKTKRRT